MKPKLIFALLLFCLIVTDAGAQEFGYPADGEGWYYIKTYCANTSQTRERTWKINHVMVNDARARDFLVYQNGEEALGKEIDGNFPFELKTRYNWTGEEEYRLQIDLVNRETEEPLSIEISVKSPPLRGYCGE